MGIIAPHTPGQIKEEKAVTLGDSTGVPNAVNAAGEHANAIWVGVTGNVRLFFDGQSDDSADADNSRTVVGLAAGVWHSRKPFKHVYLTGTTATSVRVGWTW